MADTTMMLVAAVIGLFAGAGVWVASRRRAQSREAGWGRGRAAAAGAEAGHPGDDLVVGSVAGGGAGPVPPTALPPAAGVEEPAETLVDVGGRWVHPRCKRFRRDGLFWRVCPDCAPVLVGSAAGLPGRGRGDG